jgi:pimeloyl-ACP methyl ester carboxylesterase
MSRKSLGAMALLAIIVLGASGFYATRNPESRTLDDAARNGAPGKFVRLSDGVTHYELSGPDSARMIVLVHGFSVPYYIWDSTAAALSAAGRHVLRYDQFGRGLSDRPSIDYTADVYDRQLGELLDSLHVSGPVDIAGVSMGGWVTATFTGRHPKRVRSLILVDPVAGPRSATPSMFSWPLVGSYLWQTLAVPAMAGGQSSDFLHPDRFPGWADRYRPQTQLRGFGHALLSTRQNLGMTDMDSVYRTVAQTETPVMLIWGTSDHTVPFEYNAGVRKAIPAAEFHAIEDSGHLPILERAALTDSLFLSFLARQTSQ